MSHDFHPTSFFLIKCWKEFAFDQAFCSTIVLDEQTLQCFDAVARMLYPEASYVHLASQDVVSFLQNL